MAAEFGVREVLEATRAIMTSPDRVVNDPEHMYERADGRTAAVYMEDAARGCFLGAFWMALLDLGMAPEEARAHNLSPTRDLVYPHLALQTHGTCPWTFQLETFGADGCVLALDKALEALPA